MDTQNYQNNENHKNNNEDYLKHPYWWEYSKVLYNSIPNMMKLKPNYNF